MKTGTPISILPLNKVERTLDKLMEPIMMWLLNSAGEAPQRTHIWNNHHLWGSEVRLLRRDLFAYAAGDPEAGRRVSLFIHLTRFGGWRKYAVLEPTNHRGIWHLGWSAGKVAGVSRIPTTGPARALIGPGPTGWFALDQHGRQIQLSIMGYGRLGTLGPYSTLPLF